MKFLIPEIMKEDIGFLQDEKYEILRDDKDILLVSYKINDSELIFCNVLYRKLKNGEYQRLQVIADISDYWEFYITDQRYDILDNKFGYVEIERSITDVGYLSENVQELMAFPLTKNVFSILNTLEENKVKKLYYVAEVYARILGEYGVDEVITGKNERYTLSSIQPSLDSVVEKKNNKNK